MGIKKCMHRVGTVKLKIAPNNTNPLPAHKPYNGINLKNDAPNTL
jgi:hypothetical protein